MASKKDIDIGLKESYTVMSQVNNRQNVATEPVVDMMPGIKASWTLVDFVASHGKLKYCPNMVNKETGEEFNSLACVSPSGTVTFIHFSQNLGELSASQVVAQKNSLQVCQLSSGTYSLCKQGNGSWQDLDI